MVLLSYLNHWEIASTPRLKILGWMIDL